MKTPRHLPFYALLASLAPIAAHGDTLTVEGDLKVQNNVIAEGSIESQSGGFILPDGTVIDGIEDLGGGGGTAEAASSLVVPGTSDVKLSVNASGHVFLTEAQGDIPMFGQ